MRIPDDIIAAAKTVAPSAGVDAASMLTVIEVETGGRALEPADLDPSDGLEPAMLFERHIFLKRLKALAPELVAEAKRQGLTVARWQGPGSAQYADQKTSAGRLALVAKAAALHAEAAYQSVSMGLFQVMGFNHAACGFDSAVAMHAALTRGGLATHLAVGVAFMRSKGLLKKLAARDWAGFAKGYNGTAYAKNAYDKKLAAAYARWTTALRAKAPAIAAAETVPDASTLKMGDRGPRVRALQESLAAFGVPVKADSIYGPATRRAVAAAQVELGMPGDGVAAPAFVTALESAPPLVKGEREVATKKEVKQVSFAARVGDRLRTAGAGGLGAVGIYQTYAATVQGTADQVRAGVEQAKQARDTVQAIVGEGVTAHVGGWMLEHWQALALAGICATGVVLGGKLLHSAVRAYRDGRLVA